MSRTNWWAFASVVLLAALILTGASNLLGSGSAPTSGGTGMMGHGMASNRWIWQTAFLPFRFLMPLLFLALPALGIIGLTNAVGSLSDQATGGPAHVPPCAGCGRTVQAGWQLCPYCGHKLP